MSVSEWFNTFCSNIRMSSSSVSTISNRYHSITKRINKDYYYSDSDINHSLYVGSYGRGTEILTSDIDMLVELPYSTYKKFNAYTNNGQSALLQEVKSVIEKTYSHTSLKADGQIISIPFTDKIDFEVLPAFKNNDNTYTYANSKFGGSWKITDPKAEIDAINKMNTSCNKNLKRLCRMVRAWKDNNNVAISGILIDILAYSFLSNWENSDKSYIYYDWMSRDFFEHISNIDGNQNRWKVMGSGRYIEDYGHFQSKARNAYNISLEAIKKEKEHPYTAKSKWRDIYGTKFPS